jgi:hypothetical protein
MSTNLFDLAGKCLEDADGNIYLAKGTTVPANATAGYATGAIFYHTDGSENTSLYVNEGTSSSSLFRAVGALKTDKITLTSAQVKALRATPQTLVSAPGANKMIVVESVALALKYGGTNAFTESADNLVVQYDDSGTDITGSIETTGFIDQTASTVAVYYPAAIAAMAYATAGVNEGVQLFNTGDGEIAGNAANDNTLVVSISYRIVDLS